MAKFLRGNLRLICLLIVLLGVLYIALINWDFSEVVNVQVANDAILNESTAIEWSREALRLVGRDVSKIKPTSWPGQDSPFSTEQSCVTWADQSETHYLVVYLTKDGPSVKCRIITPE